MKIINRIPSSADQIDKETAKLFTPVNLLDKAMPIILLVAWVAILFAIFSS